MKEVIIHRPHRFHRRTNSSSNISNDKVTRSSLVLDNVSFKKDNRCEKKEKKQTKSYQVKTYKYTSGFKKKIKQKIFKNKPSTLGAAIRLALKIAKQLKKKIKPNASGGRVIPIPKVGGILPLIPIFAVLSALGALSGGAAGIAKAVNDARAAKKQLEEANRHNRTMETIAMGKGLYLKPYKTGLGVFLRPATSKNY